MAAQGPPPQMVGPPTSGSPMTSIGTPVSVAMQPPQPRMPGAQGSVRLTASARQEYEAYVQSRLRMRGPQGMPGGPRMPGPPPGVIPAAQPRMAIVVRLNPNHYPSILYIHCTSLLPNVYSGRIPATYVSKIDENHSKRWRFDLVFWHAGSLSLQL